jgi:hypothetical protein
MLRVLPLLLIAGIAQAAGSSAIYTCVDATGKRFTSDRPIAECNAREQQVLNADGSVKRVIPPNLTADERAALEAKEREEAAARAARTEAMRRDRNLMQRFPNEASHNKAREAALDPVRRSLRLSESRLELLAKERKPLMDETEFYVGKPLPGKLKMQIDANDAAVDAQRALIANQQAEVARINDRYDIELQRLKLLWAGAAPGSLGPMAAPASGPVATAPAPAPK